MGLFDFLKRNKTSKPVVVEQVIDDVELWETIAYGWLCDALSEAEREIAWARFVIAYPEHAYRSCNEFWWHIHQTEWHRKHKHHHHHEPYGYC